MRNISLKLKNVQGFQILIKYFTALIVSTLIAYILTPEWGKSYKVIHTILEIFCITIALSSFFVVWYVSKIRPTNIILGFGFLTVAIFDTFHIFFWQGLGLFPAGYYDLSARHWLAGRFFEALFLILSTTIISKLSINRWVGLFATVFFTFSVGFMFYYSPDAFPVLLTPKGVTPIKVILEYIVISMFVFFLIRVYKGYFQDDKVTKQYLILAILIAVPAELCFTVFTTITDFFNVLGHILKITYYFFFLKAVFAGFVVFPYKMLRASEERFVKAFRSSPVLKSIQALRDRRFIDVNDKWLETTGFTREEVIGKTARELNLVSGEVSQIFEEGIRNDRVLTNYRYSLQTKHRVLREGVLSTQEIELQEEPCLLAATIDITDQVRHEKELLRLDRLNLIGQMAAAIGHEVRNPMTTVRGFLQMLGTKPECLKFQDYFKIMIEELDRANSIITEFLSLSTDKSVNLQKQNLNRIIDDLFPLLQSDALNADKNVRCEKSPVCDLLIDRNEIHQLILNLVRNGFEAMQPGGTVIIKIFSDGGEPVLAISDEGTGIDPNILDKIGTPFFTTKEQGTGMGLATCFTIAERNNASMDIETSSSGTTFNVRFKVKSGENDRKTGTT